MEIGQLEIKMTKSFQGWKWRPEPFPIGMNFGLSNLEMLNFMKLLLNELIWFIWPLLPASKVGDPTSPPPPVDIEDWYNVLFARNTVVAG